MSSWSQFISNTKDNTLRELYLEAVGLLNSEDISALDIAAGAMNETRDMLKRGFTVTAIDSCDDINGIAKQIGSKKLSTVVTSMEDYDYRVERFNFIVAMFALPFISPDQFQDTFAKITESLKSGGIFAFHLFGENHEYRSNPKLTFFEKKTAKKLVEGFEIIKFKEIEKEDTDGEGKLVHLHVFQIIIKKS